MCEIYCNYILLSFLKEILILLLLERERNYWDILYLDQMGQH